MSTDKYDVANQFNRATDWSEPTRNPRRLWTVIAAVLVAAIFSEAVFAGAMLSGFGWGRAAHSANAVVLIGSTLVAGLISVVTLRRIPHGPRFGLALLSLAVLVFIQTAVGRSSAHGTNLMWVHVPLGVALAGFAAQAVAGARKLGGE